MPLATDTLYRFLFTNAPVKGELVQLPNTWHTITHTAKKRAYPAIVTEILGQMKKAFQIAREKGLEPLANIILIDRPARGRR